MLSLLCILCFDYEAEKIRKSEPLINQTLRKECFAQEMDRRGVGRDWTNRIRKTGKTLQISTYDEISGVLGFTYAGDTHIRLNTYNHDRLSVCGTSSVIVHEFVHTLGYRHFVDVAYAAGYAFGACCAEK